MEPLRAEVDYSVEDYIRAYRFLHNRSWLNRYSIAIVGVSIFVVMFLVLNGLRDVSDQLNLTAFFLAAFLPAVTGSGLIYVLTRMLAPWFARRSFRKQIDASPMLQEVN